jgi:mRNA interferase YafQ
LTGFVWSTSFKRAYKRTVRRHPDLARRIEQALRRLVDDPFDPNLKTHKLKGVLDGAWACTVEYDCRIVFEFLPNRESDQDEILLIDIGTHDEVY